MKRIGNFIVIYRVVAEQGFYVSHWVTEKKEAKEIMENVKNNIIFGGGTYHIEEATLRI